MNSYDTFYQKITCTVSGTTLTIPEVVLASTTDSTVANAVYTATLATASDRFVYPLLQNFFVDPEYLASSTQSSVEIASAGTAAINGLYTYRGQTGGYNYYNLQGQSTSTTLFVVKNDGSQWKVTDSVGTTMYTTVSQEDLPWDGGWTEASGSAPAPNVSENTDYVSGTWEQLTLSNQGVASIPPQWPGPFWNVPQVKEYVNGLVGDGTTPFASATVVGKTSLSVNPVLASDPIAVGDNDPRIYPTTKVTAYAYADLPVAGTVGRLAEVTDNAEGIYFDNGTNWVAINGRIFDVSAFGATGDGSTDDTTAIQAAITAAGASGKGGTVYFPRPSVYYKCTAPLSANGFYGVSLLGTSSPMGLAGTTTGALVYTGSGASAFLTARGTQGFSIKNMRILYTSATFTGDLIDMSGSGADTSFAVIDNCELRGSSTSNIGARCLVNIFTAIIITIKNSQFTYATVGILGKTAPGYSNVINIENNTFLSLETASIKNAGEQWNIVGNTFEPLRNGQAGAYTEDQASYSVNFDNNWFGDVGSAGTPWILWGGNFLTFTNNLMGSAGTAQTGIVLGTGSAIQSVTCVGNGYNNPTTCIATAGGAVIGSFNSYGDSTNGGTYFTDALTQVTRVNIVGNHGNALYNTEIKNAFAAQYTTLADITTNDPDKNHIGFFDGDIGGTHYAFGLASRADGETPIELFTGNATPSRRLKVTTSVTSYVPLIFSADNTHDIGAVGATRPRTVYAGTSVITPVVTAATSVTAPALVGSTSVATPSLSVNSGTALTTTNQTGTGNLVLSNSPVIASPTLTTPAIGVATGTSLSATGLIKSSSATAGIGYATGAGTAGTQGTSRTTAVTANGITGSITLFSTAGSATPSSFTVNNTSIAATDVVIVNQKSGTDKYVILVTAVAANSFEITNYTTGGTTSEAPVFSFAIIKGVTS